METVTIVDKRNDELRFLSRTWLERDAKRFGMLIG
jgi:hypothetical protein